MTVHRIFHISDIHLGPPFDEERGRLILAEGRRIAPDLTVVSGDLVQRADYDDQWRAARAFLDQLPTPQLVVPGNHDVPLYHLHERFLAPLRRFRQFITPDLMPIWTRDDLVVVGVATARSLTTDGGKITTQQLADLEAVLRSYPDSACKLVVMHHHIAAPPGESRKVMANATQIRRVLDRCGVEMVLCGHTHASYIGNTLEFDPELRAGTVIVQAGTATSRRGRRWYRGKNAYFIIEVEPQRLVVTEHLYLADAGRFVPVSQHIFPRRSAGIYALPSTQQVAPDPEPDRAPETPPSAARVAAGPRSR